MFEPAAMAKSMPLEAGAATALGSHETQTQTQTYTWSHETQTQTLMVAQYMKKTPMEDSDLTGSNLLAAVREAIIVLEVWSKNNSRTMSTDKK